MRVLCKHHSVLEKKCWNGKGFERLILNLEPSFLSLILFDKEELVILQGLEKILNLSALLPTPIVDWSIFGLLKSSEIVA